MIKSLQKKIRRLFVKGGAPLTIIPRDQHNISRSDISKNAVKVLYRLKNAGFQAFLVGGGVRDTLLGLHPKDFDVTTNATPEQITQLFRNARLIGRRFKLVHIRFGPEIIEVATFRAPPSEHHSQKVAATGNQGMILRDNVYGSKDEDAMRRDFTVNALYYDIKDFSVHAYDGGWEDLQNKRLRLIGDPSTRYHEDPVRMLRAIRFAAKLDFTIDPKTEAPIKELAHLLAQIPPARLYEETLKLFLHGHALKTFHLLRKYHLFEYLFPQAEANIASDNDALRLAENTMLNTDIRIQQGKSVTPYFFMAALLWPAIIKQQNEFKLGGMHPNTAMQQAIELVLDRQVKAVAIPKRLTLSMREVWLMQAKLLNTASKKCLDVIAHPRFRAAFDFLVLRVQSGEKLSKEVAFWEKLQLQNPELVGSRSEQELDENDAPSHKAAPRKRQRRNYHNRSPRRN